MPRAPKTIKRPVGNPQKVIDWNRVDKLLISGLVGSKIAEVLGIHPDTLYNRCEMEKGTNWSAYLQQKRTIGDALLHEAQFDKAIGNTEKGDNTLLIFLGKVRLEQRETTTITVAPEVEKNYLHMMEYLAEMQRNRQNVSPMQIEDAKDEL